MRIVFAIALLSVVAQSVTLEFPSGGYMSQSSAFGGSETAAHKASVAALKTKISTGIANAKKALKTAKGSAKKHIEQGMTALTNLKKDLPGLTQADLDSLSAGAGEIGAAVALFAKGDFASIAQGVIKVGQQAYKLGKGIYNKYQ